MLDYPMSLIMLSPETLLKFALFGCKNTAQLVLMSVCLSVRGQPFYIILQHPECSRMYAECMQNVCRMFHNVPECSTMFQNVSECSRIFQNVCRIYAECSRIFQNIPECMQNICRIYAECSRMYPERCRKFQNVKKMHADPWGCMHLLKLACSCI